MQSETIKHKVNVFISSRCDGKYTIVRKALKELLDETSITSVYVFETEPASSQSLQDAYLQYVDEAHLCLFLIDNEDGESDGVLREYQRAKQLGKKIICIFCNEKSDKPTEIEKEMKSTQSGKYLTVRDFSDITKEAYVSVLQDILDVYKNKKSSSAIDGDGNRLLSENIIKTVDHITIDKNIINGIQKTKSELIKILIKEIEDSKTASSELDEMSSYFLNVILCNKKYDVNQYDNLCNSIIQLHQGPYREIISLRLRAIKYYYEEDLQECIDVLTEAINKACNKEIANWISNDIAIDLRNMIMLSDTMKNIFSLSNIGQEHINKNNEPVLFPLLDRYDKAIKEKIVKQYYSIYTDSPYITTLGGQMESLENCATCYYIALLYGSITHLVMTRSNVIESLHALCFKYHEHGLLVELIKMLIIERRDGELENLVRVYNQSIDVVNSNDVAEIQRCIESIPFLWHRRISELLLIKYFGYYFSDTQYKETSEKIAFYVFGWIDDANRSISLIKYIFEGLECNSERMDNDCLVDIILRVLSSLNGFGFYEKAYSLSSNINYEAVSNNKQKEVLSKSIEIVKKVGNIGEQHNLQRHLVNFKNTASIETKALDAAIEEYMSEFYNGDYGMIALNKDIKNCNLYIDKNMKKIYKRNEEQGKNGIYHGYATDPYSEIRYAIEKNGIKMEWEDVKIIINGAKETLMAPKQSYQDKCRAVVLIAFLKNHYGYKSEWKEYMDTLACTEDEIYMGNSDFIINKDNKTVFYVVFQMMLFVFNRSTSQNIVNAIVSISYMDDYDVLQCLKYINTMLNEYDYTEADKIVLASILSIASMMTNHKERDVRYYAVKCLMQLAKSEYESIIFHQLSSLMDKSTSEIKAAIIGRLNQNGKGEREIKEYILKKGKVDNNYWVRKIANNVNLANE